MSTLSPKSTISHYRVIELIARGGMGEVYKALDVNLGRRVAIKIPTGIVREDEKARLRFLREARSAARLSHPNICTIFEVGEENGLPFIVMEYLDGSTVQALLTRSALPIEDVLKLVVQIADALEESHRSAIIHRDLKPSNVIVTGRGRAMILDFGLAKRLHDAEDTDGDNPTVMQSVTTGPSIVGTVSYMSPEQVRAHRLDARSDVFSFGVLLYEMLTGVRPFTGSGQVEILHAILHNSPAPPIHLRAEIGADLNSLILHMLEKDVSQRAQSIAEVKSQLWRVMKDRGFDLSGTLSGPVTGSYSTDFSTHRLARAAFARIKAARVPLLIAGGIVLLAISVWMLWPRRRAVDPLLLASLQTTQVLSWKSDLAAFAQIDGRFSSNGKSIVYAKSQAGNTGIWTKQIVGEELPVAGTLDAAIDYSPIFSPDDEQVAFVSSRGGSAGIWRTQRSGGTPELLARVATSTISLVQWSRDGKRIYFESNSNLYELDLVSQKQTQLTSFETGPNQRMFSVSKDETRIAYIDSQGEQRDIWMMPIRGGNATRVTNDAANDSHPHWHSDGERIVYNSKRNGIDQICLAFIDGSTPVQLTMLDVDCTLTDVSADGTRILYSLSRDEADIWKTELSNARTAAVSAEVGVEFWPDLSSQGLLAYQSGSAASLVGARLSFSIFSRSLDVAGGTSMITSDGYLPKWAPDGSRLAFLRAEKAARNSLWVGVAGAGSPVRVVPDSVLFMGYSPFPFRPNLAEDFSWSPDSTRIAFSDGKVIRSVNVDNNETRAITEPLEGSLIYSPIWAPRGEQIAATSITLGKPPSVTAIEVLEGGHRRQIYQSQQTLRLLGWTSDGGELLVLSLNSRDMMITSPVSAVLYLLKLDGSNPQPVLNLTSVFAGNVQLSRDGTLVVWTELEEKMDSMRVLDLSTRKIQKVAQSDDERTYLTGLAWVPDKKAIYYSRHSNTRSVSMIDNFR